MRLSVAIVIMNEEYILFLYATRLFKNMTSREFRVYFKSYELLVNYASLVNVISFIVHIEFTYVNM